MEHTIYVVYQKFVNLTVFKSRYFKKIHYPIIYIYAP